MAVLESLADDGGGASWLLVGLLALSIPVTLVSGDPVWTAFLVADLAVLVLPAVAFRDPEVMLPPEVTALAVLPGVSRVIAPAWVTEYATYVGVAAVSLAVVVEIALFTEAEMSERFAAAMVVLTTMAAIGVWAVVQFHADQYLGTDFIASPDALMWEFVRATAAGVVAAGVFHFYFRERDPRERVTLDASGDEQSRTHTSQEGERG
ncbi:hypothetical protein [Halorussus litoreus]|uniref:hypothetical protein n=1 Tax=Halorussus litoreus TaxID=1710536 RepID=UPI000E25B6B9|nr:hypothetical protein [Halorussus litoreus]